MSQGFVFSQRVRDFLDRLKQTSRVRALDVARLILSLAKDPRPQGSWVLSNVPGGSETRIWLKAGYKILYVLTPPNDQVDVSDVEEIAP
jgi:hypothetical protein